MPKQLRLLVLLLALGDCRAQLPPHVWLPVSNVEAVDLFWWTATRQCTMRVLLQYAPDDYRSFDVDVDPSLCVERLRGDGFDVSEVTP